MVWALPLDDFNATCGGREYPLMNLMKDIFNDAENGGISTPIPVTTKAPTNAPVTTAAPTNAPVTTLSPTNIPTGTPISGKRRAHTSNL